LALYFRFCVAFFALLSITILFTVIIAALLRNLSERYLGLPVLSLPFVLGTWIALLAAKRFDGVEANVHIILYSDVYSRYFPEFIELYLHSLAAALCQLSVSSGALILVGLLLFSRWAVVLSVLGFSAGYLVYTGLGGVSSDLHTLFAGFNFVLTAIAVGGVFIVLKPGSIVLSAIAGAICAMISAALLVLLTPLDLPILALPFIATTQLLLFVVMIRTAPGQLRLVRGELKSPEDNLNRTVYQDRRYPDPAVPVVYLPVKGQWKITQGVNGDSTHKGLHAHAWDFEVQDDQGRFFRDRGKKVEDYYAYRALVVAPGDAKVARVVDHVDDNAIGEVDTNNNWGNLVILWHGGYVYSALCHLLKGSIQVKEGETVTVGQIVARVGNSGRSPKPHLHFQLQTSAEIGAPTCYGEFIHYLSIDGDKSQYITHGTPAQDTQVSSLTIDDSVIQTVTLAPGKSWRWAIHENGARREESWQSEIDHLGNRRLREDSTKAAITIFVDSYYTTMLDYSGSAKQLLGLFYLGAPRIPYLSRRNVAWTDIPSVNAFMRRINRLMYDLVFPFYAIPTVRTQSALSVSAKGVLITTDLKNGSKLFSSPRVPERIEVEFTRGIGPSAIRAFRDGKGILSAEVIL
jgi:urea transporter/murein DD-endopeptidase MepM/ murein hydrolase activator NlpD